MLATKAAKMASVAPTSAISVQTATAQDGALLEGKASPQAAHIPGSEPKKKTRFANYFGMISTLFYVLFASLFACGTFSLCMMADHAIVTEKGEYDFTHNPGNISFKALLQVNKILSDTNTSSDKLTSTATQSLSYLSFATCDASDQECADKFAPAIEKVVYLLGTAIGAVPNDMVFQKFRDPTKITVQYIQNLVGWNSVVMQFSLPGEVTAVTCSVCRAGSSSYYQSDGNVDSLAFCSPRVYDADWVCENDVALGEVTHVINVQYGLSSYLGNTTRSDYYNPLNSPTLMVGEYRHSNLMAVRSNEVYNDGIIRLSESRDIVPAYSCKKLDRRKNQGWLYQCQSVIEMTWAPVSSALMLVNAVFIVLTVASQAAIQWFYLPKCCASVVPIHMATSYVGIVVLGTTYLGNYNIHVLAAVLKFSAYPSFDYVWYQFCGVIMMASIVGIMSSAMIQMVFRKLATPPYVLTIVSVASAIIVFVVEGFVLPQQYDDELSTECIQKTSITCWKFLPTGMNSYYLLIILAVGVVVGCAIVLLSKRNDTIVVPASNSVLQLLCAQSIHDLVVSSKGGCVEVENGVAKLDASLLLASSLVRVSNKHVVKVNVLKYVLLYRLLPISFIRRYLNRPVLVLLADKDRVTTSFTYVKLSDLHLSEVNDIPRAYR